METHRLTDNQWFQKHKSWSLGTNNMAGYEKYVKQGAKKPQHFMGSKMGYLTGRLLDHLRGKRQIVVLGSPGFKNIQEKTVSLLKGLKSHGRKGLSGS